MKKIYNINDIVDEFGQLPIRLDIWLFDNANKVKVDICYLRNVLMRLVDLKRLATTHLAESDIPRTVEYLLKAIPDGVWKEFIKNKKDEKRD